MMIDFNRLKKEKTALREKFLTAKPFPHIVIDDFLLEGYAEKLYYSSPQPQKEHKVNDFIFTKNKFQLPNISTLSNDFEDFYHEITSDEFKSLMSYITGEDIFIDKSLYGGGLHLGDKGSYLDMHADFNYHPKETNWYRNINLLLYLNKDWKKEYGGSLKLHDSRNGDKLEIEPILNRLVIMHCRDYTLHGYDAISFPPNTYRTSVALYGYTYHDNPIYKQRSTLWAKNDNVIKNIISNIWEPAVKIKKSLFS